MPEDFGALHPHAAQHRPYLDEMAAWRNAAQAEAGLMSGLAEPPYTPPGPPQTREEVIDEVYRETWGEETPKSFDDDEDYSALRCTPDEVWEESLEVNTGEIEIGPDAAIIAKYHEEPVTPKVEIDPAFQSPEELQEAAKAALVHPDRSYGQEPATEDLKTVLDAPVPTFDPSEHNAVRVLHYLKSATVTEIVRVMFLEREGKARKGILGQEEDLTAKARKREN